MLYLFLTGRRAAYLNDIFTVLHLPENSIYDLKYKIEDNPQWSIIGSRTDAKNCKEGMKTLISYTTLKGKSVPLRWGYLQKITDEEGQRYYSVRLAQYCHTCNSEEFQDFLKEVSNQKLRHITLNDENGNEEIEGILTFVNEKEPFRVVEQDENSWSITVRQLGEMDKFSEEYYSIFTKVEIKSNKKKDNQDAMHCILKSKHSYKVHFTYYMPSFNSGNRMANIPINFYQTDKRLGLVEKNNLLLSEQNKIDIPFFPDAGDTGEEVRISLGFDIPEREIGGKHIYHAMTPVGIVVKDTISKRMRRILTVICVLGIFLASVLGEMDFRKISEILGDPTVKNKFLQILLLILQTKKIVLSAITAASTWGMVKLVGKAEL